jgi:hypothetical protein
MVKDSLINQQLKATYLETSILKKLNDLSYKALNGTRQPMRGENENIVQLGKIPFKNQPTDEITEERIIDYKKSLEKPARIDTTTGDAFKYYDVPPVAIIPPPIQNDPVLGAPAKENDIDDAKKEIEKLVKKTIPDIENFIEFTKDKLKADEKRLTRARLPASIAKIQKEINDGKIELKGYEDDLKTAKDNINIFNTYIEQFKDNIELNKNIVIQNKIDNENMVKKYVEDLKAVNRDKFFIEQQPNEDLGDYLTRAQALENEKLDLTLYDNQAKLEQIRIFKENLKLLIRSDVIIENVVKAFTDNEIFEINKNFNTIQNNFIEAYGYNNKNVKDMDIINFIKDILNNISSFEIDEEAPPATTATFNTGLVDLLDALGTTKTNYSFEVIDNAFYIINKAINKYIYLKIGTVKNFKYVFYSKTLNEKNHFTQVIERASIDGNKENRWFNIYNDYLQLDPYAFNELFNNHTKIKDLYDLLDTKYKLTPVSGIKQTNIGYRNTLRGWGVGVQKINDIPKHIDFGNVVLLLNQLYFKNKLSIKYKSLSEIKGFKSVKVSDNFVDLIMNILNGKEYTDKIKLLKTDEKELFNLLLYKSGIHKIVPNETDDVRQKLKERFLITEGQIISGNNNPAVYKELEDLTWKISHLGGFSKKVAEAYLKQFK